MSSDRFMIAPAVYLILVRDEKVLLQRRYNTGWADGMYTLLSGHVDHGEVPSEAMLREAKEEGDITIEPQHLTFFQTVYRSIPEGRTYIDLFFHAAVWSGEPTLMEVEKADELAWFPLNELPENTLDFIRQAIIDFHAKTDKSFHEMRIQ